MNGQVKANYSNENERLTTDQQVQQSLLIEFTGRFSKELQKQSIMIDQIQDRLHEIVNKRTPEKENDDTKMDMPDISSKLMDSQGKLEANNIRLERILNHLSAII